MANLKAYYYRFQHMIWFATGLIGIGIGLVVWWQCSRPHQCYREIFSPSVAADQSTQKSGFGYTDRAAVSSIGDRRG